MNVRLAAGGALAWTGVLCTLWHCGPLPSADYQACAAIAADQNRCTSLSLQQRAANQNECERQIKLGLEGCAEAYSALARCLPTTTCASQHNLTNACTTFAGDVAAHCGPSTSAANSNTVNTRGSVNLH